MWPLQTLQGQTMNLSAESGGVVVSAVAIAVKAFLSSAPIGQRQLKVTGDDYQISGGLG
jgi:hypothetical protein